MNILHNKTEKFIT